VFPLSRIYHKNLNCKVNNYANCEPNQEERAALQQGEPTLQKLKSSSFELLSSNCTVCTEQAAQADLRGNIREQLQIKKINRNGNRVEHGSVLESVANNWEIGKQRVHVTF
jgi:hypothetical protein